MENTHHFVDASHETPSAAVRPGVQPRQRDPSVCRSVQPARQKNKDLRSAEAARDKVSPSLQHLISKLITLFHANIQASRQRRFPKLPKPLAFSESGRCADHRRPLLLPPIKKIRPGCEF